MIENKKLHKTLIVMCKIAIIYVLLSILAGNVTNSFLLKWGFRDHGEPPQETFSLVGMMDGVSLRPFVYRSTVAILLKEAVEKMDPKLQDKLFEKISRKSSLKTTYFANVAMQDWTPTVAIVYHAMYFLIFGSFFLTLLILYQIAKHLKLSTSQGLMAIIFFGLFYPLTLQVGGHYYDFFELLGVSGAALFALKQRYFFPTLWVALFSFNKETFFLVPLATYFLYDANHQSTLKKVGYTAIQTLIALLIREHLVTHFAENPGKTMVFHLVQNLTFWLNPRHYFRFYELVGQGFLLPAIQNPIVAIPLFLFLKHSWKITPTQYKRYLMAAFAPLFILFILFGYYDELRVFILAYPAIFMILCYGITQGDVFRFSEGTLQT